MIRSVRLPVAPIACGIANLVAALAMATTLAAGTPIVADPGERERYVVQHLVAWRVGWATWMVAAMALLWAYAWWRARANAPRSALAMAAVGLVADLSSETLLIVAGAAGYARVAPLAFFLTGAIANGLYTIAGIRLTAATRLSSRARAYAAFMWSAGLMITVGAVFGIPLVTAIATALLFALFCPWCVWLAWRLR